MNILFVNENGQGNHHVDTLLWAARIFSANGANCIFSLKDRDHKVLDILKSGFHVFQGPRLNMPKNGFASFADTLANMGANSDTALKYLAREWEFQFNHRKIDLIVANFAPIVLQVAREKLIPTVNLATPWCVPHSDLVETQSFSGQKKIVRDEEVVAQLKGAGLKKTPSTLVEALQGDFPFFIFEKGFDYPFHLTSRGTGYPFLDNLSISQKKANKRLNIFVYIHNHYPGSKRLKMTILNILQEFECNIDIYDENPSNNQGSHVKYVGKLGHQELISKYDIVLHSGGLGLSQLLYASKVFQICIPQHAEQVQNTLSLKRLKAAVLVKKQPGTFYDHFTTVIKKVMAEHINNDYEISEGLTTYNNRLDYKNAFIKVMDSFT